MKCKVCGANSCPCMIEQVETLTRKNNDLTRGISLYKKDLLILRQEHLELLNEHKTAHQKLKTINLKSRHLAISLGLAKEMM